MFRERLDPSINFFKDKIVLLTSHKLTDLDGFSSVIAFNYFLNILFPNIETMILFESLTKPTIDFIKSLKKKFPEFHMNYNLDGFYENINTVVVLDAHKIEQVSFLENYIKLTNFLPNSIFWIDHHYQHENLKNGKQDLEIMVEDYSSTAEIILDIFDHYNIMIPLPIKFLLVGGILTDSGYFKYGNNHTIKAINRLLDDKINYQDVVSLLRKKVSISEKLAIIKGAQRVEIHRVGDFLVGFSHVSSYEASVASNLLQLGFDIAVVLSERSSECRISLRAKKNLCFKTGLHLGHLLEKLSEIHNAHGGGHEGAASIKIKNNDIKLQNIILQKIKEIIS